MPFSAMSRARPWVWAVAASLGCMALLGIRLAIAPDHELAYMADNLGLAWIPVVLAWIVLALARGGAPRLALVPLGIAWILFLPNAPYLVTDLVHLSGRTNGLPALDLVILGSLALIGLGLFAVSVLAMQRAVRLRIGDRAASFVVPAGIWLSAVGIYLGRVLRWNSWDLLVDPAGRLAGVATVDHPATLVEAALFIVAIAVVIRVSYAGFARLGPPQRT